MTEQDVSRFTHPLGLCESASVGRGTRIWAFAHVLPGARIGADCNICDHVFIENDVIVGDRVTIKSGVQLWDGLRVGDDVFIGPNATFTNDRFPRSRQSPPAFLVTTIEAGASVGANATILPGVRIGMGSMIGAGAVVTRDVPAHAIVYGNPAQITGYVAKDAVATAGTPPGPDTIRLGTARTFRTRRATDLRGGLVALEFADDLPFVPRRFFAVFGVPSTRVRGEHAHRTCHQVLISLQGSVTVVLDDGADRLQVVLDDPGLGLYIPPMIWASQYRFTADACLAVFASDPYDADDYIRDYPTYLREVGGSS